MATLVARLQLHGDLQTERSYVLGYVLAQRRHQPSETDLSRVLDGTALLLAEEHAVQTCNKTLRGLLRRRHQRHRRRRSHVAAIRAFLGACSGTLERHARAVETVLAALAPSRSTLSAAIGRRLMDVTMTLFLLTVACLVALYGAQRYGVQRYGVPLLAFALLSITAIGIGVLLDDPLARTAHRVLEALDTLQAFLAPHALSSDHAVARLTATIAILADCV